MDEGKIFIETEKSNNKNQEEEIMSLVGVVNEKRLDADFVKLAELISTDIANLLIEDDERRSNIKNRTARVGRVLTMYFRDIGVNVSCMDRLSEIVIDSLVNDMGIIRGVREGEYEMCGDCDFFRKLRGGAKYSGVDSLNEMKRAGHETEEDLRKFQEG